VNNGGPTESVLNNNTGYLCEPDPELFANHIVQLTSSPEKQKTMGLNGKRHVSLKFSRTAFIHQLEVILESMNQVSSKGDFILYCFHGFILLVMSLIVWLIII
jgi:alpha-1,3/alpha-1,6-mannosyltransferase